MDAAPAFETLYDESTLARLDRPTHSGDPETTSSTGPARSGWRRGMVAGGLFTGLALGLREVFDPPPDEEVVVEVDVDAPPAPERPVRFVMVDGAPSVSRIILRPWLAAT
jgi:hypothetical protein